MPSQPRVLGIAIGDPCGIGPEVALKSLVEHRWDNGECCPLLVGSRTVIEREVNRLRLPLRTHAVARPEQVSWNGIDVATIDVPMESPDYQYGQLNSSCARAAAECVAILAKLAVQNRIMGMACAPVSKAAQLMTGAYHGGHAELVGALCNSVESCMFCIRGRLAVMAVTDHVRLADVPSRLTSDLILRRIRLGATTYRRLFDADPRIAVCSLDPHCGECGFLGKADIEVVTPACLRAQEEGLSVFGPISADAVFRPYILRRYDLVIGMYHDQIKVGVAALDSDHFVALLAGVPIVRTTTTHGAAFDIAGQGCADASNMRLAIDTAIDVASKSWWDRRPSVVPRIEVATEEVAR